MTDKEKFQEYLAAPGEFFSSPADVVKHPTLDRRQKVEILRSWKQAEEELEIATSENMESKDSAVNEESELSEITSALTALESQSRE